MRTFLLFIVVFYASDSFAIQAQPVPVMGDQSLTPQLEIAGSGIGTIGTNPNQDTPSAHTGINFSDSALLVGAAQRLYDGQSIGSTGLGWLTLEDTNKGLSTQLFLNQAFLDYQGEHLEFLIGRTDNPTAHTIDHPTLRGDDLISLLNPLNPYSDGKNVEEHRYSNVASLTLNQHLKYFESIHVQHLINSSGVGSDTGINSFGAQFQYLGEPGLDAFSRVPSFAFGYEHFTLVSETTSGLHQVYGGGTINLNTSVTKRFDLLIQDSVGFGSTLKSLRNTTDSFQANSNDLAASVRYLYMPFGEPGYQLSVTGAFKNYFDISESNSYGGIFTAVKRLGQGFDLVAQFQTQWRASELARVQSNAQKLEQTAEIGFIFNFDTTINQHLAPRRSLLNMEYHYVPN
jgi:hypothetical protein